MVALHLGKIQVGYDSDCGRGFLSNPNLAEIQVLNKKSFPVKDRIQLGLIDIDVDSIRPRKLVETVFSELSDVDNHPGVGGMGVRTEVVDFDSLVISASRERYTEEYQDRNQDSVRSL
jgi:hypothetical protein